jgi:hypothetical protein
MRARQVAVEEGGGNSIRHGSLPRSAGEHLRRARERQLEARLAEGPGSHVNKGVESDEVTLIDARCSSLSARVHQPAQAAITIGLSSNTVRHGPPRAPRDTPL